MVVVHILPNEVRAMVLYRALFQQQRELVHTAIKGAKLTYDSIRGTMSQLVVGNVIMR